MYSRGVIGSGHAPRSAVKSHQHEVKQEITKKYNLPLLTSNLPMAGSTSSGTSLGDAAGSVDGLQGRIVLLLINEFKISMRKGHHLRIFIEDHGGFSSIPLIPHESLHRDIITKEKLRTAVQQCQPDVTINLVPSEPITWHLLGKPPSPHIPSNGTPGT
jgi:hypothetical protein